MVASLKRATAIYDNLVSHNSPYAQDEFLKLFSSKKAAWLAFTKSLIKSSSTTVLANLLRQLNNSFLLAHFFLIRKRFPRR